MLPESALSCRLLACRAGGRDVVADLSLDVMPGERVAVVGPSGSGKTTLLTTLGGLIPPSAGQVFVDGLPLAQRPALRSRTAVIFQSYGLLSLLTAAENVEVALRAAGRTPKDAVREAAQALEGMRLSPYAGHLIEELSGGQQQRVAVARALALRPGVILADEPTAEQDKVNRARVLEALLSAPAALVVATHDAEVADRCDRVVELAQVVSRA
jgi:putative ABC transport system ATP-binding protein